MQIERETICTENFRVVPNQRKEEKKIFLFRLTDEWYIFVPCNFCVAKFGALSSSREKVYKVKYIFSIPSTSFMGKSTPLVGWSMSRRDEFV